MFRITSDPILPIALDQDGAGGFVQFEGKVRNRNDGREVERLEYEAYAPLAEAEGQRILDEAISAFELNEAVAMHRTGLLEIGETAVWVGVAAAHRDQAFRGCSYIIDELKKRVPIWKKEHYADGDSEWIGCHDESQIDGAAEFYRRQTTLCEVGEEGQKILATAKVLVVGAGGLGCAALPYLAGAGVGVIGIAEGDNVEVSNLHRQVLFGFGDRGLPKGEMAARSLKRLNPFIKIELHDRIASSNVASIVESYDVVLDGTDNFATKFLLNDACVAAGKPLVQASLHKFEGQLLVIDPESQGGCMRCIWHEAPYDGCVGTCAEEGILGSTAGVFGALQANEVLKFVLGIDGVLSDSMLTIDLKTFDSRRIARAKDPECPCCGSGSRVDQIDVEYKDAVRMQIPAIDIREQVEWDVIPGFESCARTPMSDQDALFTTAAKNKVVLLICEHGIRSAYAARWLRECGIKAYSLIGGADAARRIRK